MKKELKKELSKKNKNKVNWSWIIKIVIITFIISILFSFISETAIPKLNVFWGIILTLVFIVMVVMLYHWWNFFQLLYVWKNTLKYIFARYRNLDQHLFFFLSDFFPESITILHHCHLIAFFQCGICYPYFTIPKIMFFSSGCF